MTFYCLQNSASSKIIYHGGAHIKSKNLQDSTVKKVPDDTW